MGTQNLQVGHARTAAEAVTVLDLAGRGYRRSGAGFGLLDVLVGASIDVDAAADVPSEVLEALWGEIERLREELDAVLAGRERAEELIASLAASTEWSMLPGD